MNRRRPQRTRRRKTPEAQEKILRWLPAQTAIIICDMWNQHGCRGATRRVGELAPAMNQTIAAARAKGVFIIHAPSSCMDDYKDHPARNEPKEAPRPPIFQRNQPVVQQDSSRGKGHLSDRSDRWRLRRSARYGHQGSTPGWLRVDIVKIQAEDAISDSGVEIWNLLGRAASQRDRAWAYTRTCACWGGRSPSGSWP